MIDSCIKRTDASFQNHLNRIKINLNPTDYIVPTEICAMINVVIDAKNQSFKLCAVDGIDVVSFYSFSTKIFEIGILVKDWVPETRVLGFGSSIRNGPNTAS